MSSFQQGWAVRKSQGWAARKTRVGSCPPLPPQTTPLVGGNHGVSEMCLFLQVCIWAPHLCKELWFPLFFSHTIICYSRWSVLSAPLLFSLLKRLL